MLNQNTPAIAPCLVALFHHTPSINGKNNPDIAKSKAQATAPRIPVILIDAMYAPNAPIITSSAQQLIIFLHLLLDQ